MCRVSPWALDWGLGFEGFGVYGLRVLGVLGSGHRLWDLGLGVVVNSRFRNLALGFGGFRAYTVLSGHEKPLATVA